MKLVFLLLFSAIFSSATNADNMFFLGLSKNEIFGSTKVLLDCHYETGPAPAIIDSDIANKFFPFTISESEDVELMFSECSPQAKLVSVTYSIPKIKYDLLTKKYEMFYGEPKKPQVWEKVWVFDELKTTFISVGGENYALSFSKNE